MRVTLGWSLAIALVLGILAGVRPALAAEPASKPLGKAMPLGKVVVKVSVAEETSAASAAEKPSKCADPKACATKGGCDKSAASENTNAKDEAGAPATLASADIKEAKPLDPTAPTHKQGAVIAVNSTGLKKAESTCFCLDSAGNLLVGCGGAVKEIRKFNSEGKHLDSVELAVKPEAINVAPDGTLLVAGEGRLLRLSAEGEELVNVESPHAGKMQDPDLRKQLREQIVAQQRSQVQVYEQQAKQFDRMIARTEERLAKANTEIEACKQKILDAVVAEWIADAGGPAPTEPPTKLEKKQLARSYQTLLRTPKALNAQLASYQRGKKQWDKIIAQQGQSAELTEEQLDSYIKASLQRKLAVASISGTEDTVFFATGAAVGYGFVVWKANADFTKGELIIKDLSGCCGQMDVQANSDGVFVAENSRHRVCRYDANGKLICKWGKGAQSGVEGFGSCCNPMNLAFGEKGEIYTAEDTTGRIKRYSVEGDLLSVVGAADLVPGCKKVSIAADKSGDRVYMLDITRHQVARLDRVSANPDEPLVDGTGKPSAGAQAAASGKRKSNGVTGFILRTMFQGKAKEGSR